MTSSEFISHWWAMGLWALFGVFSLLASGLVCSWVLMFTLQVMRMVLLRFLEVATIVEAAREAKRQDRAPILRAWTRLSKRWDN